MLIKYLLIFLFVGIVGAFRIPDNFFQFIFLDGYYIVPFSKQVAQAGVLFVFR